VLASGSLTPSPSALGWFSPSHQISGLYHASGSAVFPVACAVPCVRFNDVVRSLMSVVCVPARQARWSCCHPFSYAEISSIDGYSRTDFSCSFITATLGMNGWLGLIHQGLSPWKKRQASLGALTAWLTGGDAAGGASGGAGVGQVFYR